MSPVFSRAPPTDATVFDIVARDALRRDKGRKTVHEVAAVCLRPETAVNQRNDRPAFPNCSSSRTPQLGKLVGARAILNSLPLQGRGWRRCSGEARSRPKLQRAAAIIGGRGERASRTESAERGESKRARDKASSRGRRATREITPVTPPVRELVRGLAPFFPHRLWRETLPRGSNEVR